MPAIVKHLHYNFRCLWIVKVTLFGDIIYNFAWGSLVSAWEEKKWNIGNLGAWTTDVKKLRSSRLYA